MNDPVAEGPASAQTDGATIGDAVSATVHTGATPLSASAAQQQALARAKTNAGLLHRLLMDAESVGTLAKDEVQQVIANLGRDLQHLI